MTTQVQGFGTMLSQTYEQNFMNANNNAQHYVTPPNEAELRYVEEIRRSVLSSIKSKYSEHIGDLFKPVAPITADAGRNAVNNLVCDKIWAQIGRNRLDGFYTQGTLQAAIDKACSYDYRLFQLDWGIQNIDIASDLSILSLYDIILIGDDSGSMAAIDKGESVSRWDQLKLLIKTIGFWATLMDDDGCDVRLFNCNIGSDGNNIRTAAEVDHLFTLAKPSGITPMGASIKRTIEEKKIYRKIAKNKLTKPVLILIITDGVPTNKKEVIDAITTARSTAKESIYGRRAIAFGFCQIGCDKDARRWLNEIDSDPKIGNSIDCTSDYYSEEKQFRKSGNTLTPGSYVAKMLIGPVNALYDKADEGEELDRHSAYSPFSAPNYYVAPSYCNAVGDVLL